MKMKMNTNTKYLYLFGGISMSLAVLAGSYDSCTQDADCPYGWYPACFEGFCRECREDARCQAHSPDRPYCVDAECKECREDAQCQAHSPDQPYCFNNWCKECVGDSHCPLDKPYCSLYSCRECVTDEHCQPDEYCSDVGVCYPSKCGYGIDCHAPKDHCVDGTCRLCGVDGDCLLGGQWCTFVSCRRCVDYQCVWTGVCFAPTSTVSISTPQGGQDNIFISQLRVNDRVLTGSGDFKKVIAFSTFSPPVTEPGSQQGSQYLKITLESSTFIELTPTHMIYVKGKKYPIQASSVRIGDYLIRKFPQTPDIMDKVVSVDSGYLQGGFAPITEDGTIVVNGFLASCYSNPAYQTSEYVTIFGIPTLHRQVFTHMLKSPVRLICKYISDSPCQVKDTLVAYKMPGHEFVDKAHEFVVKWDMEDLGELFVGTIASAFFLFERMLGYMSLLRSAS